MAAEDRWILRAYYPTGEKIEYFASEQQAKTAAQVLADQGIAATYGGRTDSNNPSMRTSSGRLIVGSGQVTEKPGSEM